MKPSDKLRELGFGNQAVIVGTKRKELFGVVDKMFGNESECDHDWHIPDFGDDVDNEQFATCKKCNAWRE